MGLFSEILAVAIGVLIAEMILKILDFLIFYRKGDWDETR